MKTVTDIDFSKAPEGATHYYNCGLGNAVWYKSLKYDRFDIFALGSNEWVEAVESDMLLKSNPIPPLREKFVKVDRHINDIAKAMIDGEVFYDSTGSANHQWAINCFVTTFDDGSRKVFDFDECVHRKTLVPVDHKQEFIDAMCKAVPEFDRKTAPFWMGKLFDLGFRAPNGN